MLWLMLGAAANDTDITLYVDGINLYLMSNSGGNEAMLEVRGAEAEALRRWLEERADSTSRRGAISVRPKDVLTPAPHAARAARDDKSS